MLIVMTANYLEMGKRLPISVNLKIFHSFLEQKETNDSNSSPYVSNCYQQPLDCSASIGDVASTHVYLLRVVPCPLLDALFSETVVATSHQNDLPEGFGMSLSGSNERLLPKREDILHVKSQKIWNYAGVLNSGSMISQWIMIS
jgi:hypothetical protein